MCCCCPCKYCVIALFIVLGVGLIVFGGVWQGIQKNVVKSIVKHQMQIKNGSLLYPKWETVPIPVYMQFYFYNWTNAADYEKAVLSGPPNFKPSLQLIGPYTYIESRHKEDIYTSPDNDTVFYKERKIYTFVPEKSCDVCKDDTNTVTLANIPLITAFRIAYIKQGDLGAMAFNALVKRIPDYTASIYFQPKVRDVAFDGYTDALMKKLNGSQYSNDLVMPNGYFAVFYNNDSTKADGEFSVFSGRGDGNSKLVGTYDLWNNSRELWYWTKDSPCSEIKGSDGMMFGPDMQKDEDIHVFQTDIYRSVNLHYYREVKVNGIKAYQYRLGKDTYWYTNNNGSECYCPNNVCPAGLDGYMDVNVPRGTAPIYASTAYCYLCNQTVVELYDGLALDQPDNMDTHITVEPNTGMTIEVAKRIQVNLGTTAYPGKFPYPAVPLLKYMPTMRFPILFFNESAVIDDDMTTFLKHHVTTPVYISRIIPFICYGIGVAFIIVAIFICVCC